MGFPIKDFTEADCVAALMGLYEEMSGTKALIDERRYSMDKSINKIIYFDKETIRNILQERHEGAKSSRSGISTSSEFKAEVEVGAEAKVKLSVPILARLSFLFSGRLASAFIATRDNETTITSTEISEFEELKKQLFPIENTLLEDVEDSSTFFRVAGKYLRILKGGIEDVDTKEFNAVMEEYDGYDTYKVSEKCYVRFNNLAFVSNYKRNDLLATKMTLYCIEVGKFSKGKFDFMEQLSKMENLSGGVKQAKTLADTHPPKSNPSIKDNSATPLPVAAQPEVTLYDVLYACIRTGENNG